MLNFFPEILSKLQELQFLDLGKMCINIAYMYNTYIHEIMLQSAAEMPWPPNVRKRLTCLKMIIPTNGKSYRNMIFVFSPSPAPPGTHKPGLIGKYCKQWGLETCLSVILA